MTLRLGHITFSNCFPAHARLIDRPRAGDPEIIQGIPSHLNALLDRGEIDVAPCSSIEFARHADRFRILPDLVIGSRGPVHSIQFLSTRAPAELGGRTVALPTASATSVVLLKILLRERWQAEPRWLWFDQAHEDPFARGAHAALFIGDVALRPTLYPELPVRLDLGEEWWRHAGLPFAFAVWQTGSGRDAELRELHTLLRESRDFGTRNATELAARYAGVFRLPAPFLERYWRSLDFDLDVEMTRGLEEFYRCAAAIGEIGEAPALRWLE